MGILGLKKSFCYKIIKECKETIQRETIDSWGFAVCLLRIIHTSYLISLLEPFMKLWELL
ncbi:MULTISPECIES: hypothetical protein [unclassified Lysinibacillus]|uniref:hypothetical protein n=1 Tax=unclassified Lysinibacillus TaxID=2636778 RepID=UPI0025524F00|nr:MULTISPECIES: hypothetical protein [unclassified Lysinibacillus]MDM5248218.1 hypothetical protein [Lysinibacillus sp. G4S2]